MIVNKYRDVAALVRNGGDTDNTLAPNDSVWVQFTRYVAPMFALPASIAATHVTRGEPRRFLTSRLGTACLCFRPQPRRRNHFPGLGSGWFGNYPLPRIGQTFTASIVRT